ncbi:MAG: hypothetical protein KC729_04580, partial [Candidatus Eisenbacteria bacterium]|nr:hypothetical protein [Candidatus Eisenbacteria bacterium]
MPTSPQSWLHRALIAAVAATVFCASFHTLFTPDYWFHLRGGAEIWSGHLPRTDAFSYPSLGRPYLDMHWLFQAILYGVHRLGGVTAAVWFKVILVGATFALLYRIARRDASPGVCALSIGLAVILASERFQVRPELATFLGLAGSLWLVQRHREGWRPAVWLFPLLQALWVNMEGLFVLGYVVLGAALLDHWRDRRLWLAFAGSLGAALLNPYFLDGALHPLVLYTRIDGSMEIYSATITEFLGPFAGNIRHPAVTLFPYFLALLGIALVLSRRPRRSELLLVTAFVVLAFQARRNLALFAVVSAPILARWLATIPARREIHALRERLPRTWSPRAGSIVLGLAIVGFLGYDFGLVTNRTYAYIESNREFGSSLAVLAFPEDAARFMKERDLAGPVFSTLSSGSYLIWADPARPVFVDGRLEVHSAEHYAEYLSILAGGAAWDTADQRYRFGVLLLDHAEAPALTRERLADPAWAAVWIDSKAVVLVRRDDAHAAIIAECGYDQAKLLREYPPWSDADHPPVPPSPSWSSRYVDTVHAPWPDLALGQLLNNLGAIGSAARTFRSAAFAAPELGAARILEATALNQLGRSEDALGVVESAERCFLTFDDRMRLWATRGDLLLTQQRGAEAEAAYDRYLSRDM